MFSGPYGVSEDGTYSESIAVRREDLCLVPDNIDDATAGRAFLRCWRPATSAWV
jgi:D-arabinose 1-dehydrogenase-like Zn-dependent alcohol dehydrogenase